jgi:hypothetical protein
MLIKSFASNRMRISFKILSIRWEFAKGSGLIELASSTRSKILSHYCPKNMRSGTTESSTSA